MRRLRFLLLSAALAGLFRSDSAFRSPHGWPTRCASAAEARAINQISAAGGWVSSTGYATKVEFPEHCLSLRPRDGIYVECGNGWQTYDAFRDPLRRATDAEIRLIQHVPEVIEVDLCGTAITDSSLWVLSELPRLRSINVFGTALSETALSSFADKRPDVKVFRDDPLGFTLAELYVR